MIDVHFSYNLLIPTIRMWRKERHLKNSTIHICSIFFYTKLREDGPDAVKKWNAKIDIFAKKFIFISINESLHWSLCVVVNPGAILNNLKELNEAPADEELYPCILFFDSLKVHQKQVVARNIRNWLNWEWNHRFKKLESPLEVNPFTENSFPVHAPSGKQ